MPNIHDCPPPTYEAQERFFLTRLGVIVGQRNEELLIRDAAGPSPIEDFPRLAWLELERRARLEA